MGLRSELEPFLSDGQKRHIVRTLLQVLTDEPGKPCRPADIAARTGIDGTEFESVLKALERAEIVTPSDTGDGFVYVSTPLRDLEIDRFLRSLDVQSTRLMKSAQQFRNKFRR